MTVDQEAKIFSYMMPGMISNTQKLCTSLVLTVDMVRGRIYKNQCVYCQEHHPSGG